MGKYHSYLDTAKKILQQYKGEEPLASFLKNFFAQDKKYGSKDRKQISHLCYCYFRLGKACMELPVQERILTALFVCSNTANDILEELKPQWGNKVSLSPAEKFSLLHELFSVEDIFPFSEELSDEIDKSHFSNSYLKQPDVFLRLRPGKEDIVKYKLTDAGIDFEAISANCLSLQNAAKIDNAIELDSEAVVQDRNSQQTGTFLQSGILHLSKLSVWDCCAGSGGKSIMLYDDCSTIDLTVSDKRESILSNLKKRFNKAGITDYTCFSTDLVKSAGAILNSPFDLILADVPCTGSGTWSRTPEQLYYFEKKRISEYAALQKKILVNIIPHLKPGGHLLYITCSVFKKENEDAVIFIQQNLSLQLIKMEILEGYDKKADTLFAALLQKPL